MQCPIDVIEVLQKMKTLDEIYQPGDYRKWHYLRAWLNEKAAQQSAQADKADEIDPVAQASPKFRNA